MDDADVVGVVGGVLGVVDGLVEGDVDGLVEGLVEPDVAVELGVVGSVELTVELGVVGGVLPPPQGALLIVQALGAAPLVPVFVNSIPTAAAEAPAASGPAHVGLSSRYVLFPTAVNVAFHADVAASPAGSVNVMLQLFTAADVPLVTV